MKAVILAGGFGTRISEESHLKPKPMIEIGDKPILWHIMKLYSYYGVNDFVICAGYKQHVIKEWFANYYIYNSDITFDFTNGEEIIVHKQFSEPWKVTVVDTGLETQTGGRIRRIRKYVKEEPFFMTYGDGVSDVNIGDLLDFHNKSGCAATMTVAKLEGRFGVPDLEGDYVKSFREKSREDMGWVNVGYMVLEPGVFDYLEGDGTVFEGEPLERLARDRELACFKHQGFWKCMDTKRDMAQLEHLWQAGEASWKVWDR